MTTGVPTSSFGQRARLMLLVGVLLALAAGLAPLHAPRAVAAEPLPGATVDAMSPRVATPGGTLRVAGTVHSGDQRLRDVEVRLRLSRTRLSSRAELAGVAAGQTESRDGDVVARRQLPTIAAGKRVRFDLSLALDEVSNLTDFGVYVLGVEVVASGPDGFGRVAITRTFLPWVPENRGFRPTGFSWLWPLVGTPARLGDGTFANDRLAAQLAPEGRLGRLVAAGARLSERQHLTWVVDPDLLQTVQDMADGYLVRAEDGSRVEGTGATRAALWLDQLRDVTAGAEVLSLPYGDPDVMALHRAGMMGDLIAAHARGEQVAAAVLGRVVRGDVAWPADGYASRAALGRLRGLDMDAAILDGRAAPPELPLSYTPTGRASIDTPSGSLAGLLYDPVLADTLADPSPTPLLGSQRFLAETAMITAELPSTGTARKVLVAPPRRWNPDPAFLERLVEAGAQSPWMGPVSVSELVASEPPEIDREPVAYSRAERRRELPQPYLAAVGDLQDSIGVFASILTDRTAVVPPLEAARLRLESSAWRAGNEGANRLAAEQAYVADQRSLVQVLPGNYTFGSKSGTIPLTITNGLEQEVNVEVRLRAESPRLVIGDIDPVTIGPQRKVQVEVPAKAVANGLVFVRSQLYTPAGTPYDDPVQVRVRITQYGTVALVITVGAAGVLFLAAGVRLIRRGLAAQRRGR